MDKIKHLLNNPKALKAAGISLITLGFLLLGISKIKKIKKQYSLETVIQVLINQNRSYFPVYRYLRQTSQRVLEDFKEKYKEIPETVSKNMEISLMSKNPEFRKMIIETERKVLLNFNITDKEGFQESVKQLEKTNAEVRELVKQIQVNFVLSCQGQSVEFNISLPKHINESSTLKVYKSYVCHVLKRFNEFLLSQTTEDKKNNIFDQGFNTKLLFELEEPEIKQDLLHENNFDFSEVFHEEHVFEVAIETFSKNSIDFRNIIQNIDVLNNTFLQLHLNPTSNLLQLKDRIKEIEDIETDSMFSIGKERAGLNELKDKENNVNEVKKNAAEGCEEFFGKDFIEIKN